MRCSLCFVCFARVRDLFSLPSLSLFYLPYFSILSFYFSPLQVDSGIGDRDGEINQIGPIYRVIGFNA